jgi:hypothetical protein
MLSRLLPAWGQAEDGNHIEFFVDRVSLAYHEARNVRHLIRQHPELRARYGRLVHLPVNRLAAWRAIQDLRQNGQQAASAHDAERVFIERFQLSLEDLAELFRHQGWRDAMHGGNAWALIANALVALCNALEAADQESVPCLLEQLRSARHNTGQLQAKLETLDASLRPPLSNS